SLLGMSDFGVELNPKEFTVLVSERGLRGGRRLRDGAELAGRVLDAVAVAHPDDARRRKAVEERARRVEVALGPPELAVRRGLALAAQELGAELEPVADSEDRDAEREDLLVDRRRVVLVDRRGPAREDDPLHSFDGARSGREGDDLRI